MADDQSRDPVDVSAAQALATDMHTAHSPWVHYLCLSAPGIADYPPTLPAQALRCRPLWYPDEITADLPSMLQQLATYCNCMSGTINLARSMAIQALKNFDDDSVSTALRCAAILSSLEVRLAHSFQFFTHP